jgi:hypothetical protein
MVKRRQEKVHAAAIKSAAIVSSLFPKEVRDRLYQVAEEKDEDAQKVKGSVAGGTKKILKNYLGAADAAEDGEGEVSESNAAMPNIAEAYDTKPIADLFPHATVYFADIAGFTAWSSVREPTQVFTLLETVYRAFDSKFGAHPSCCFCRHKYFYDIIV